MSFKSLARVAILGLLVLPFAACDDDPVAGACGDLVCDANATCDETDPDNLVCECNDGYTGDGETCTAETAGTPTTFTQVSAGGNLHYEGTEDWSGHTCAIAEDGTLWCWGTGGFGQLGTGSFTSAHGAVQVGTETDWIAVDAKGARTCGIRGSSGKGTLWCWGSNRRYPYSSGDDPWNGILGLGDTYDDVVGVATPTQVGTASDWSSLGLANHSACGIRDDGTDKTVWCWGSDENGALADGSSDDGTNEPTQEDGSYTDWAYITGSTIAYESNMHVGIRDDGAGNRVIWSWGYGGRGLTGGSSAVASGDSDADVDTDPDTDWQTVVLSGDQLWCGIKTAGTLWCAGSGNHGQAGQGDFSSYSLATQVGTDTTWTAVSAGRQNICGVNAGKLYCWGRNHVGELGLGSDPSANTECDNTEHSYDVWDCNAPIVVDDTETWVSTASGRSQNCGLTDEGSLYCWGHNGYGQTGVLDQGPIVYEPTMVQ